MENVNQKSILGYRDYRLYIRDYYFQRKADDKSYSLSVFAGRIGLSKMAVKYVIDGKRHISDEKVDQYAEVLNLRGDQRSYFRQLVRFNKCRDKEKKTRYLGRLVDFAEKSFPELSLSHSDMGLFRNWWTPVIAEMSYLKGFRDEVGSIEKGLLFSVRKSEILESLKYLKSAGFLRGGSKGAKKLQLPSLFRSQVYSRFVVDMTQRAKESICTQPREDRESFEITISVDESRFELAKQMIQEFREDLHRRLASDVECDRVIQLNTQLFTVAKSTESE